jgi:hypothetical protein
MDGAGWHAVALPEDVGRIRDAATVGHAVFVIAEDERGVGVLEVSDGKVQREDPGASDFARFLSATAGELTVLGGALSTRAVP